MHGGGRDWCDFTASSGSTAVRFRGEDANHHCGDVVVPAVHVCFLNKRVHDPLRFSALHQQLLNPAVVDHARESVNREKKCVADSDVTVEHIGIDVVGHSDTPSDDVALGV